MSDRSASEPVLSVGQLNAYLCANLNAAPDLLDDLERQNCSVLCLQEITEPQFESLSEDLGFANGLFHPMGFYAPKDEPDTNVPVGVALLSALPLEEPRVRTLGPFYDDPLWEFWAWYGGVPLHQILLEAKVIVDGKRVRIATTHGAWAPDAAGSPATELQVLRTSQIQEMLGNSLDPTVLAADFNRRVDGKFLEELPGFRSSLPEGTVTTIDPSHRAIVAGNHFEVPVDDILYNAGLQLETSTLATGFSDHQLLFAQFTFPE